MVTRSSIFLKYQAHDDVSGPHLAEHNHCIIISLFKAKSQQETEKNVVMGVDCEWSSFSVPGLPRHLTFTAPEPPAAFPVGSPLTCCPNTTPTLPTTSHRQPLALPLLAPASLWLLHKLPQFFSPLMLSSSLHFCPLNYLEVVSLAYAFLFPYRHVQHQPLSTSPFHLTP